jgi:transglutaminase-like putative cysteine protease
LSSLFSRIFAAVCLAIIPVGNALLAVPLVKPSPVTFNIAAAPAWVKKIELASKSSDEESGGISYLLVDRQDNVALQSAYYHEARQVTSENGVQNGAAVTVSFDPAYQELIFHSLQVTRGGTRANRLDRSQIKLLQREKDMESFLYDGAYTAQCELEDIRAGDIIEFSYTIKGANPVLAGRYARVFYTDWSFPTHRVITRFLYPAQRKLHFLTKNVPLKPVITSTAGTTEWLSDQVDVPARRMDSDAPADYDPNGWVQVSEYENWQAVADWARPLFQSEASLSADLQAAVATLRQITDAEKRVLAALKLVQDQLRYLGIESGVGSHRPTSPSEVFRRRFGDCKDKALLLATLLQQSGIDAVPALVSTDFRGTVAERLPAPNDFDHAIVQVKIGDKVHWLDPTRSSQRGPLSQIYVRDLKQALVLRAGTRALTSYSPPQDSLPWKTVTENYRVPAPGETGELEVVTESHGLSAERTRSAFQESGREKIEKQYLQYYARRFPRVTVRKSLVYEEIPEANACRTREFYSIPEIWTMNEEEKRYELELQPGDIAEAMGSAGPSQRDDPLALNYPAKITEVINAKMFDQWSINAKNQTINNAFYRFGEEAKVDGRNVSVTYTYEALADRVAPGDLANYNAGLSKIRDKLGYTLFYQKPGELFDFAKLVRQFNWRIASLVLGVAFVVFVLCVVYFLKSKLPVPLPPPPGTLPEMQGLGGWLILVGIHHVVRPFFLIAALIVLFPTVLNLDTWRAFTEPGAAQFHPYYKPMLLAELFFHVACLIFSGLLLLLFFRKRAVWPRCYAAFLLFIVVFSLLDFFVVQSIPAAADGKNESIRDLVQVISAAAIWVPYCFVSKRVKATFRR